MALTNGDAEMSANEMMPRTSKQITLPMVLPVLKAVTRMQARMRPFACEKCGCRYARNDILTAHKRLHDPQFRRIFDMHTKQIELLRNAKCNVQQAKEIETN